jgi:2-polyprenyl-6-methoxyphenol hydroxylase-like FAD-dependent oxidoreductase
MLSYIKKYTNVNYLRPKRGKADIKMEKDDSIIEFEGEDIYYDILIAADGANSWIAKNLNIGRVPFLNKKLFGLVANVSKKKLKSKSRRRISGYYNKVSKNHINIVEHEKPQNNWRFFRRQPGGFYLGMIIDSKEYEDLSKKHLSMDLKKRMKKICEHAKTKCNIKVNEIGVFPIQPSYLSKIATKGPNNSDIFFVGDAMVSTHYFTGSGLNIGFSSVNILVSFLNSKMNFTEYTNKQASNIEFIKEKVMSIS